MTSFGKADIINAGIEWNNIVLKCLILLRHYMPSFGKAELINAGIEWNNIVLKCLILLHH